MERAGTVQTEEKVAWGELINANKYLIEGNEDEGARLFTIVLTARTRDTEPQLRHMRLHVYRRKHFFLRVVEHWHRSPRVPICTNIQTPTGHSPGQLALAAPA